MSLILDFLVEESKITMERKSEIKECLKNPLKAPILTKIGNNGDNKEVKSKSY